MFLPYETTLALWLRAVPTYELEPEPPPAPPEGGPVPGGGAEGGEAAQGSALPPMRLVFKGMRWITVPVWNVRESAAWEQVAQDRRSEDEERADEVQRRAKRPAVDEAVATATEPGEGRSQRVDDEFAAAQDPSRRADV